MCIRTSHKFVKTYPAVARQMEGLWPGRTEEAVGKLGNRKGCGLGVEGGVGQGGGAVSHSGTEKN